MSIAANGESTHIVKSFEAAANEDLTQRLSSWYSAPDPSTNLNDAQTKRQEDTGIWLLQNPIFLRWKSADHSLLWLHGKAGSGKTVLSSTVIRFLLGESKSDTIVVYFYFDFQTHEKQIYQNFLHSIVVQLFRQHSYLSRIVEEQYNACGRGVSRPTVHDTLITLRRLIDTAACPVYVVVDALDECRDRRSSLEGMEEIRSWNQVNLHILITSRRETEVEDILSYLVTDTIFLEESVVDKDILTYVQYQLQNEVRLSKWSEKIQEEIETALVNGANGMFRWVECQLDAIRVCMKLGLLRTALRSLPQTLDETYARILIQIPEAHVEDARRILSCLICAFGPLAIEEIADIVAVIIDGEAYYDVDSRLREPNDVLIICSGLVSKTDFKRKISRYGPLSELEGLRLSHFSIKEYLTSDRIADTQMSRFALDERYAHELTAKLCINYLLWCGQEDVCQDPQEWFRFGRIPHRSPFALYAASFWSDHFQAAHLDSSSPLYSKCLRLLSSPSLLKDVMRLREAWPRDGDKFIARRFPNAHLFRAIKLDTGGWTVDPTIGDVPPLCYVSMLGVDELVLKLLAAGEDINKIGPGLTSLAAAAFFGHEGTLRLLLDNGADVNAAGQPSTFDGEEYYSPSAIACAAETGRENIVKMLLAEGADVNIRTEIPRVRGHGLDFSFTTALEAAVGESSRKFTRIVQLLLDAGADVRAGGHRPSAKLLYKPMYTGNLDVMTMLLDAGVDPNEHDSVYPPLVWAIRSCEPQYARMFIEHGADLESIDSSLINALYELRDRKEYLPAIEIALDFKPNLNLDKLMFAAAKYGQVNAVKFLLRNGITPDVQVKNGVAALHAAAFMPEDDIQIVELLLNAGADVNIHGGLFGSALQAAAMSGKTKAVRLLLKHGALPNYARGTYGTALEIAEKRLEDLERRAYNHPWRGLLKHYGPVGYYEPITPWIRCFPESVRPAPRIGIDYVPHFDFSYLRNADYQGIIDALRSHGAR